MIKIVFKDCNLIEIENSDDLSSKDIFYQICKSKLIKIYDYIFNLDDVLYIKIVK